jgi:hypothetical protein
MSESMSIPQLTDFVMNPQLMAAKTAPKPAPAATPAE